MSQVTTSQNCVKLLFDVIKLAVRFQKDVSEAWIKVRCFSPCFPYVIGLIGWAWAFLVLKCDTKSQTLVLRFADTGLILCAKLAVLLQKSAFFLSYGFHSAWRWPLGSTAQTPNLEMQDKPVSACLQKGFGKKNLRIFFFLQERRKYECWDWAV